MLNRQPVMQVESGLNLGPMLIEC